MRQARVIGMLREWPVGHRPRLQSAVAGPVREQPTRVLGEKASVTGDASAPERAPVHGHPRAALENVSRLPFVGIQFVGGMGG